MSSVHVAHDIPGRLRLRLPTGAPTEGLQAAVGAAPGVTSWTWSPRTRSLLVLYDPEHGNRDAITHAVAEASGLHAPLETHAPPSVGPMEPGTALAVGVRELFGEVDDRVQRATRGVVGLSGLFRDYQVPARD